MMNNENKTVNAPTTSSLILEERHDSELFRVYALILDGITDHVLLPGKKLTESELCRQMTCSRNTVRGALSLLAHDKIVDLQPNRGAFVHVPDLKEMQDVFNARIEMEGMILGMLVDLPDLEARPAAATAWAGTAFPTPSTSNWRACWTTTCCSTL